MACTESAKYGLATLDQIDELGRRLVLRPDGDEYVYQGPCPRCCHQVEVRIGRFEGLEYGEDQRVRAECRCDAKHTGRDPADLTGCGFDATYSVRLP